MAKYPSIMLTNAGLNMIAESQGNGQLIFTTIKLGDGSLGIGEDIKVLTDIKNPLLTASIGSIDDSATNGQISLNAVISNTNVETGFFARELGVYAKVGNDGIEKLYAYTNAGNYADYMPDKSTPVNENQIKITLIIGNAANVTAVINESIVYVTKNNLKEHNESNTAHPYINGLISSLQTATDMLSPYYARLNHQYIAEATRKMRYGENITITFMGDSNMMRQDSLMQTSTLTALNGVFNETISRIDRAYPGDSAKLAYDRWGTAHDGNITVICFGTNDSCEAFGYPDSTRCRDYQYWMEKLITRELNWGKAVVLVSSLPPRNDKRWETKTQHFNTDPYPTIFRADVYPFNGIVRLLANKYSAPFFDSKEALGSYEDEIFAGASKSLGTATTVFDDPVHLTDEGLRIWGYRLASIFYGDSLINPRLVMDGSAFATRKGEDPFTTNSAVFIATPSTRIRYINTGEAFGVGDKTAGNRYLELWDGEEITYSFYCQTDDLIVYPCVYAFGNSLSFVKLDYGARQPAPPIDEGLSAGSDYGYGGQPSIIFDTETITSPIINLPPNVTPSKKVNGVRYMNAGIRISSRGWHTVNIRAVGNYLGVSGLRFRSYSQELIAALKIQINSLPATITNINDLNRPSNLNNIDDGTYYAFTGVTNTPNNLAGIVRQATKHSDSSIAFQEFFPASDTTKYWTRMKLIGTWGSWTQIK